MGIGRLLGLATVEVDKKHYYHEADKGEPDSNPGEPFHHLVDSKVQMTEPVPRSILGFS
jgi:hypothetical protein